jgi:hypothetical protein
MRKAVAGLLLGAAPAFGFLFSLGGVEAYAAAPNELRCIIRSDMAGNLSPSARTNMLAGIMALDYVDGFHVQLFWKNFEPANNSYDYTILDDCISAAEAAGKKVSVALCACYYSPQWLFNGLGDSAKFTYTHPHPAVGTITTFIPWNTNYKIHLNDAIQEIADNYDGVLDYVTVTGPSSLYGVEVNFPLLSIDAANSNKLAFTRQKFEDEWKESIDFFADTFTNSMLGLSMHTQIDLPTRAADTNTAPNLRSYLLSKVNGAPVVMKLSGLNHETGLWPGPYDGIGKGTAYQELIVPVKDLENVTVALETMRFYANYASYPPEKLRQILVNGLSYDGNVLEMYREDIWDVAAGQPLASYSNEMAWCGNYGINQVNITHEQGSIPDYWDSSVRSSTMDIGINFCGLADTSKGLRVDSAVPGSYVAKNLNLDISSQRTLRFRFYLDPNSVTMALNDSFRLVRLKNSSGTDAFYLSLGYQNNGYRILSRAFTDVGSALLNNSAISDAEHWIEVLLTRASSSSASDGTAGIWIDDSPAGTLTGLDNYDRFDEADLFQFGNCYADQAQGTSGYIWLDEVKIQGHGEFIGPRYQ